jgi:hypothetical protein
MKGSGAIMGLTVKEKQALIRETYQRYQKSGKKDKSKILDEVVQITSLNRKYLLHLLANWGKTTTVFFEGKRVALKVSKKPRKKRTGKVIYGPAVVVALKALWEYFGFMCGQLLSPFIRANIAFLEQEAIFHISPEVKEKLLAISSATINRKLKSEREKLRFRGVSGTKPGTWLKNTIPIRVHYPWNERKPGFFEIDTVHHCGTRELGEFNLTLDCTDVYSGWVILFALLNKAQKWVFQSLATLPQILPFPLLGLDSDNGSEFINEWLRNWCERHTIQFTRSRAYHKNDNCFVEQKNNACVRKYVGYYRFDSPAERDALNVLYQSLCPLLNYFLPTMKLIGKSRVGSRVRKVYEKIPKSPYQRLLESPDLSDEVKAELRQRFKRYNPVLLQKRVHQAIDELMTRCMTVSELAKELKISVDATRKRIETAGVQPLTREAIYDPKVLEILRTVRMGRPPKAKPDK